MNAKQKFGLTFALVLGIIVLAVMIKLPSFARAKARSGPNMSGNLFTLELLKREWETEHTNEWPMDADLFGRRNRTINEFKWRYGELYVINRTGEPPIAYIPKDAGPYHAGEFWYRSSNGLVRFHGKISPEAWKASGITNAPEVH